MRDEQRRQAAAAARAYCAGQLSSQLFSDQFVDATDNDIDELAYLIEHERSRRRFVGPSERAWRSHRTQIEELIAKLDAG